MTSPALLEARSLRISQDARTIVDAIDFSVGTGETVGVVGESGSGKSLTARALLGVLPPGVRAEGIVRLGSNTNLLDLSERKWRSIRGRQIALMLQDPFTMLNPVAKIGAQLTETLPARFGKRGSREARDEASRRLAEVGIRDPRVIDAYPFQLSGGMRQRVALAATLACDPQILVADEPSTALDVTTQREILALLRTVQQRRGMALVLITHDLRVAFSVCTRVYVLYAGRVLEVAGGTELEQRPLHPYSLGLLLSEPSVDQRQARLVAMEGTVPQADALDSSCAFAERCRWVAERCRRLPAPLLPVGEARSSACIRVAEIKDELAARRADAVTAADPPKQRRPRELVAAAESVCKAFRSRGGGTVDALDDVSLAIGAGEAVGLVGESGSGKTTLARCLVGLEGPDAGRVVVDGFDVPRAPRAADRRRLAASAQIVFQDPYSSLNPVRTVGSTLHEAIAAGRDDGRRRPGVGDLLDLVGLPASYAHRKPLALSGGERQRVAIARALAVRPKLIVCDEPVSALDVSVQAQILNLFESLRSQLGVAYLFITHDLAVVRQVADHVYVLLAGRVVEDGPTEAVLNRPNDAYTARLLESVPRVGGTWLEQSPKQG